MILELDNLAKHNQVRFPDGVLYDLINIDELTVEDVISFQRLGETMKSDIALEAKTEATDKMLARLVPGAPVGTLAIGHKVTIIHFFTEMFPKASP